MTVMNKSHDQSELDDAGIEALLRQVGGREEPDADVMREVRNAVHAEWQAAVRARVRQRQRIGFAIAAGVACAAAVAVFTLRSVAPEVVPVATIARIDGHLQVVGDQAYAQADAVRAGQRVSSGSTLRTDAATRAALEFGHGVSVRVDANSTVRLAAADRLVLEQGALYVDARTIPNGGHDDTLKIETTAGAVRHLGTQYQVRMLGADIVVSVREGRVEVTGDHGTNIGAAGERLRVSADGNVQRSHVSAQDDSWNWAEAATPGFEIADQPLSAFLAWVARETGRKLIYDDPRTEALAQRVRLRGSIAGLSADAALAAVLPTTNLHLQQGNDDSIRIGMNAD